MKKIIAVCLVVSMFPAMGSVVGARSALVDISTVEVVDETEYTVEEIYESVVKAAKAETEAEENKVQFEKETVKDKNATTEKGDVKVNSNALVSARRGK